MCLTDSAKYWASSDLATLLIMDLMMCVIIFSFIPPPCCHMFKAWVLLPEEEREIIYWETLLLSPHGNKCIHDITVSFRDAVGRIWCSHWATGVSLILLFETAAHQISQRLIQSLNTIPTTFTGRIYTELNTIWVFVMYNTYGCKITGIFKVGNFPWEKGNKLEILYSY